MDRESYQKSGENLKDYLISSLLGMLNMDQMSSDEHEQREIFGSIQNHHNHIGSRRIQPSTGHDLIWFFDNMSVLRAVAKMQLIFIVMMMRFDLGCHIVVVHQELGV